VDLVDLAVMAVRVEKGALGASARTPPPCVQNNFRDSWRARTQGGAGETVAMVAMGAVAAVAVAASQRAFS